MSRINHMLLLLILLASPMDSQIITFWLRSVLPAPPQDHEPTISSTISLPICKTYLHFHQPHTETRQWGPHPSSVFYNNSALPGARTLHWGTRFCICTSIPKIIYYLLFIVQTRSQYIFCHHSWRLFLFWPYATHVTLGLEQHLSFNPRRHCPHLQSTQPVSYPYPLNLFTLSRLWHNLAPVLSSTYYSPLLHGCGHHFLHISSNQGQS
jgi:hypothetical protein